MKFFFTKNKYDNIYKWYGLPLILEASEHELTWIWPKLNEF